MYICIAFMHGMSAFRKNRIARTTYIYDNTMIRSQNWINVLNVVLITYKEVLHFHTCTKLFRIYKCFLET